MRTSTRLPSHEAGPIRCTSLFWRVRPVSRTCARAAGSTGSVPSTARRDRDGLVGVLVFVRARRNDRVDQDLDRAAEPGAVALEPDGLLERQQLVEAPALHVRGDVVREPRRGRAGPLE